MNKMISNNDVDIMLKNYCSRRAQIAFDIDKRKSRLIKSRKGYFAVAVSVVAVVLVFSLVLVQVINTDHITNIKDIGVVPKGFVISACAAEREPVTLQSVEVGLYSNEETGIYADIIVDNGMVAMEPIRFNMSGDDIETFDYKCKNGTLCYVIPELKDEMLAGDDTITQNDYFNKGQKLERIPYDSNNPRYIYVSWYNYSLDQEGMDYLKGLGYQEPYGNELTDYRAEHLKTEDDFNRYFGDTINVTAHYKNGTSETAVIEISLDVKEEGGKIYANYVLKYI